MSYPRTNAFDSATIILPVINETSSLVKTVDLILQTSKAEVRELLIVICDKTTPESMATIKSLSARLGDLIVVHRQKLKFLGGAMREAFDLARGSHTIMMASDLETDPALVPRLIAEARAHPAAIVTVTRWHTQGGFENLQPDQADRKLDLPEAFLAPLLDKIIRYDLRLPDFPDQPAAGHKMGRIAASSLVRDRGQTPAPGSAGDRNPRHLERAYRRRIPQNPFARNLEYFRIGLRVRFAAVQRILRR